VLVESHLGRPVKIEGNPDHPASRGGTSPFAQAQVLGLYDPDRAQAVKRGGRVSTWDDFLEDVIGKAVTGYRAASFSITRNSLWALDILIDAGFEYDSSVFPIHHDRYGIPGASPEPGRIVAPSQRTLVEFPMSAASFFGVQVPVSGGGYFRILPYWVTRAGLKQINEKAGRPFTFYLHPWEVDPEQPRVKVSAFSRFRHYTNLHRCEARLRRVLGDFRFGTMRQVLEQRELLTGAQRAAPERVVAA